MSIPPGDDGNGVADTRNGKPLLAGSGGEQCPGSTEKDSFQFPLIQLVQQVTAKGNGAASAAGTAGMNILGDLIDELENNGLYF